jgi:hypothetical protein
MGRAACPACGANVDVALDVNTQQMVALELNTDASTDAPRYRYIGHGERPLVERVPDSAPGDFYPLHNFDCPEGNAGRTF